MNKITDCVIKFLIPCMVLAPAFIIYWPKNYLIFPNSDFENGNLDNWNYEGEAFSTQPTFEDNPVSRGIESSLLQGNYWVGTYENRPNKEIDAGNIQGDFPTGTLKSKKFIIKNRFLCFLSGGGRRNPKVRLELKINDKKVIEHIPRNHRLAEHMGKTIWDLKKWISKEAQIFIFDLSQDGWGHINVDHFHWCH